VANRRGRRGDAASGRVDHRTAVSTPATTRCRGPCPPENGGAGAPEPAGHSRPVVRVHRARTQPAARGHSRPGLYQCNECREQFTVMVGSVFERSKIPLNKWLLATFLLLSSKKGMSTRQIHRMLDLPHKTAWFMTHRIREALKEGKMFTPLGGTGSVAKLTKLTSAARLKTVCSKRHREVSGCRSCRSRRRSCRVVLLPGPSHPISSATCCSRASAASLRLHGKLTPATRRSSTQAASM
jgi:transposase-like protein